jgi:hypothetical protein
MKTFCKRPAPQAVLFKIKKVFFKIKTPLKKLARGA